MKEFIHYIIKHLLVTYFSFINVSKRMKNRSRMCIRILKTFLQLDFSWRFIDFWLIEIKHSIRLTYLIRIRPLRIPVRRLTSMGAQFIKHIIWDDLATSGWKHLFPMQSNLKKFEEIWSFNLLIRSLFRRWAGRQNLKAVVWGDEVYNLLMFKN